jgi:hypothetical protein
MCFGLASRAAAPISMSALGEAADMLSWAAYVR